MVVRASVILAAFALLAPGAAGAGSGWKHVSVDRRLGAIDATISYDTRPHRQFPVRSDYRRMTLVLRRAGKLVIDGGLSGAAGRVVLKLRNVWGNAEPEALVRMWTGGNRCCTRTVVGLVDGRGRGRVLVHDFPYGGAHGQWHRGRFYFISRDLAFMCAFTACAGSSTPIQIFAIDRSGRRFVDVTRNRLDLVAADAAGQWQDYLRAGGGPGLLAPWCAEQYLLGRKRRCDRVLARELARGRLRSVGGWPGGRAFIRRLHEDLVAWGYAK